MPKSSSATQKKKRLVQLRDAQRRRRERLREEKQHFVQIILPEKTLGELSQRIAASRETMQQIIARLVQQALLSDDLIDVEPTIANLPEIHEPVVDAAGIAENDAPVETPIPEILTDTPVHSDIFENEDTEEYVEEIPELTPPEEPVALEISVSEEKKDPPTAGQLDLFG